jgi:hypothetical protein
MEVVLICEYALASEAYEKPLSDECTCRIYVHELDQCWDKRGTKTE